MTKYSIYCTTKIGDRATQRIPVTTDTTITATTVTAITAIAADCL